MSVGSILTKAGNKLGLNPNNPANRNLLLLYLNEGAREFHRQADYLGSMNEQIVKINGDQTISCEWYVGSIRAMRECASFQAWHIKDLRPRYNQFNWGDVWRNYRLKNLSPLKASIINESVLNISVPQVENPPVQV